MGAASGNFAALFFVNLAPDEVGPVDTLRLEFVVTAAGDPKISLVVTAIDRKGPLVVDLESGSGVTPRAIKAAEFTLVAGPLVDALSYLGRNVAGFSLLLSGCR